MSAIAHNAAGALSNMAERVRNQEVLRSVHAQSLNVQRDLVSVCLQYWSKLLDPGGRETRRGEGQSNRRFKLT